MYHNKPINLRYLQQAPIYQCGFYDVFVGPLLIKLCCDHRNLHPYKNPQRLLFQIMQLQQPKLNQNTITRFVYQDAHSTLLSYPRVIFAELPNKNPKSFPIDCRLLVLHLSNHRIVLSTFARVCGKFADKALLKPPRWSTKVSFSCFHTLRLEIPYALVSRSVAYALTNFAGTHFV